MKRVIRKLAVAQLAVFTLPGIAATGCSLRDSAVGAPLDPASEIFHLPQTPGAMVAPILHQEWAKYSPSSEGRPGLIADTRGSAADWNTVMTIPVGVLKGGRSYRFHARFERAIRSDKNARIYLLLRSEHLGYDADKWLDLNGEKGEVDWKYTLLPADDYTLQLGIYRKGSVALTDLTVREGSWERRVVVGEVLHPSRHKVKTPQPVVAFSIALPPAAVSTVSLADFGASPAAPPAQNLEALRRAIAHCRTRAGMKLTVPAGVYRLPADATVAFTGLTDFVLEGQGTEFRFTAAKPGNGYLPPGFEIAGCRRCAFRNFTVDWDWAAQPLAHAVTVTAVAPDASWFDVETPFDAAVDAATFYCLNLNPMNAKTRQFGAGTEYYFHPTCVEQAGKNRLRIYPDRAIRPRVGQLYCARHFDYQKHAFSLRDDRHLTLQGITLYSFPGMGFVCGGDLSHWQLLDCAITPRRRGEVDGPFRSVTSTADGLHVNGSQGYLRVERCDFSGMGDDGINLHDPISQGVSVVDAHTLILRDAPAWRCPFRKGDRVELRRGDLSPLGFIGTVTAVQQEPEEGQQRLTFAEPLPARVPEDTLVRDRRFDTQQFVIRDCKFHANRARGMLLLASHGRVERNVLYGNQQEAIVIETTPKEGFGASDLVLRNNRIEDCNRMASPGTHAIRLGASGIAASVRPYPALRNISLEGNRFVGLRGGAISLDAWQNITVKNNLFACAASSLVPPGTILAQNGSGLTLVGNQWNMVSPGAGDLRYDSDTVTDLTVSSNNRIVKARP